MNELVDFYGDLGFYFSVWEVETACLEDKSRDGFTYSVSIINDSCLAYIKQSSAQSSSLIMQFRNGVCCDKEGAFSLNNRGGRIARHKFKREEYSARLVGVSLRFSSFIPGCILTGSSSYSDLNAKFTKDKAVFDAKEPCGDFLLLLGEKGQILQEKYALEKYVKSI